MTPFLHITGGSDSGTGGHAHLLIAESGGMVMMESPDAVMAEVEFRATHVSALMNEMFAEAEEHNFGELTEA